MKIQVTQIIANPYRDMSKYPIDAAKVQALEESMRQTDFWDNLISRVKGNEFGGMEGDDLVEYLRSLDEAPKDMIIELGYGHHRLEAIKNLNITEINIPVKVIDDEIMLQIMANENKGDWSSNMSVILETVRQVRNTLHAQVVSCEDFEEYTDKYSFFKTQKNFTTAKSIKNIGYRRIHEFLGETWAENDIRFADATLKAIDDGLFDQEQVIVMPNISLMNRFARLAKNIREQVWPDYFKDLYVASASVIISNREKGATVPVVTKAATMVKKGNVPTDYLLKQKIVPFDLVKQIKALISDEESGITIDDIADLDGLKGTEGLGEALAAVLELIAADDARREKAGGAPEEGDETATAETTDVEGAIASAEAEAGELVDPTLPPVEEGEVPTTLTGLADTFMQTASVFAKQTERLIGQIDDLDESTMSQFGVIFEDSFIVLARVGLETYGKSDLLALLERAENL